MDSRNSSKVGGREPFADMLFGEWSSEPLCPVSVASGGWVLQGTRPLRMMRFGPTGFKTICGALRACVTPTDEGD